MAAVEQALRLAREPDGAYTADTLFFQFDRMMNGTDAGERELHLLQHHLFASTGAHHLLPRATVRRIFPIIFEAAALHTQTHTRAGTHVVSPKSLASHLSARTRHEMVVSC